MAEPEVRIATGTAPDESIDVEMQGEDVVEVGETGADDAPGEEDETMTAEADKPAPRATFVEYACQLPIEPCKTFSQLSSYLKSPVITLLIGSGSEQTTLSAHQALLIKSPFFADAIAPDSPSPKRSIELIDDDLEATSCFLEYLYTGEYFPHKLPSGTLESDPASPSIDDNGAQLLKHAKVYTLAEKLGLPALKTLSHSKIHLVTSTALAEITYARYVYAHTKKEDATIRKPVASFWGQRSHVLRHETEGTFRKMVSLITFSWNSETLLQCSCETQDKCMRSISVHETVSHN